MSAAALELKKRQTEAYFRLHSDSLEISILTEKDGTVVESIPGFFQNALITEDARQIGAVEPLKRIPNVTFYSEYADKFTATETYIFVETVGQFLVAQVKPDETPGTFEASLWLVQA